MFLLVDFGTAYAGLATVGYAQHNAAGAAVVARTTTGVVAFGNGAYGVAVTPNAATVVIKWDSGGGSPSYAHESIAPTPANILQVNSQSLSGTGTALDPWGP